VTLISINFSEQISGRITGITLGILFAGQIIVEKKPEKMKLAFQQLENDIKDEFRTSPPSAHPVVSAVRRMYRRIGWEPTQYRPSSEAMIRRLIKNKGLYHINNIVDLGNIASTRFHLPMGLYDYDKIAGTIQLDVGREEESYRGIGKEIIHAGGKLVLRDSEGVFGNPTADSKRTSITAKTTKVLAVFFTPPEVDQHWIEMTLAYLENLYKENCPQAAINKAYITAGMNSDQPTVRD